jgi:hypothetical protein
LKAADAALFVAKRGVRLPSVYADLPAHQAPADRDTLTNLPSLSDDSF